MRVEGKSVCLSPEGTRSTTLKLADFKKGAFFLAMQAGVPIVPIVIHNSGDVQPKGDRFFHPGTVEVEVLPPVDTSKWSEGTIDKNVAEVRTMYLKALGQEPTPRKRTRPKAVLSDVSASGASE
jgi:putative phosphoserine phosphatase/1-acylglycerol-3-phosphate O-acyltransferase